MLQIISALGFQAGLALCQSSSLSLGHWRALLILHYCKRNVWLRTETLQKNPAWSYLNAESKSIRKLWKQEFTALYRDLRVEKDALYCPAFGSKKCCYSKRWISLKRKLPFAPKLLSCTEMMGLRWPAVLAFITHSSPRCIASLRNHSSIPSPAQCDFSLLPAHFQLISHPNTNFPGWFILLLMDQSSNIRPLPSESFWLFPFPLLLLDQKGWVSQT